MSLTHRALHSIAAAPALAERPPAPPTPCQNTDVPPLRVSVERALERYFAHLEGQGACGLYDLVLAEVEAPLLAITLAHAEGNQSKAAQMLGLNRGTLRKKLKQYDLL